jgi:hypothetical protein
VNREVRDRWTAALRSGDYVQGHARLRVVDDDGRVRHCCLGVLCELAVAAGVARLDAAAGTYHDPVVQPDFGYGGVLPPSVVDWAGLRDPNPAVDGVQLSYWNDIAGSTFASIADKIERCL